MMTLWIPVTIAAAFLQNLRSALQKAIKDRLSTTGAAYARFLYALPFAAIYVWMLLTLGQFQLPASNTEFLIYCALGGISQILFTVVLLWMFSFRSFAVGTTFSKLEIVLIAILGSLLLGDKLGPVATLAIVIGAIGTVVLSSKQSRLTLGNFAHGMGEKATWVGLLCAALLGASVVFFRGAALALNGPDFIMAAAFTLFVALTMQTLMMGTWFIIFDRPELFRVVREWRRALPVGIVGMACSVCWFTAFTLQNAAYVRALGQIELIFTFVVSIFYFREKITKLELLGIILIASAVILILLAG
ncbi:MAG: EamA family transporter [Hyphomicrobiales bacterium]|nr:EamA family transporter [Hyphomicrobiales bacterium]